MCQAHEQVLTAAQAALGNYLHFINEEMGAQRGSVTHQGSHSVGIVEPGFKIRLRLKAVTLTTALHEHTARYTDAQ